MQGATVQATYFDPEKKAVSNNDKNATKAEALVHISGTDILTNAQVNVASICITSAIGSAIASYFFH